MEALSRSAQYIANFEPITLISALAAVTEPHRARLHRVDELQRAVPRGAQVRLARPHQRRPRRLEPRHLRHGRSRPTTSTATRTTATPSATSAPTNSPRSSPRCGTSWDDDAFMRDKESGQFFDPGEDAFRSITRASTSRCSGPLNIPRPPQGHPVIVQAGTSDDGMDVAARFAEVIFSAQPDDRILPEVFQGGEDARAGQVRPQPRSSQGDAGPELLCRPHRGRGEREIRLPELADASDRGARNPLHRARRRRSHALRLRRPAAGESADVEREPEHVQIRHRAGEEGQPDHAADRAGGGRRARQAAWSRARPSRSPTTWSNGTSRKRPTASTSCRRTCPAGSTISSSW